MEFACYAAWDDLPESADALFAQAEKESIFFSQPWFENLVNDTLEDGQSMLLACVVERGRVLTILPLMRNRTEHGRSLGHLYTSLYTLLLADKGREEILACLVQGLNQLPLSSLRLSPIAENDGNLERLQQAMESSGFSCHRFFRFYNWTCRLHGQSFADFMAARPSRVRNTIARKQRKLEREHGYTIHIYTRDDLPRGIADYNTVYKASWKANELFGGFIGGLASSLSDQGWLRLAILYIEDKPAAAQFWFVAHKKASIFKLAYDESWKKYSPGSILTSRMMEYVIDIDEVEEIDFLTGNDDYKQDWMSERRERWGLCCAKPRRPKGRAEWLVNAFKGWIRLNIL